MTDDLIQHPHVMAAYHAVACPRCQATAGQGLVLASAVRTSTLFVALMLRCLRCGSMVVAHTLIPDAEWRPIQLRQPAPDPVIAATADEALDLHEALAGDDWWVKLTGSADG